MPFSFTAMQDMIENFRHCRAKTPLGRTLNGSTTISLRANIYFCATSASKARCTSSTIHFSQGSRSVFLLLGQRGYAGRGRLVLQNLMHLDEPAARQTHNIRKIGEGLADFRLWPLGPSGHGDVHLC